MLTLLTYFEYYNSSKKREHNICAQKNIESVYLFFFKEIIICELFTKT